MFYVQAQSPKSGIFIWIYIDCPGFIACLHPPIAQVAPSKYKTGAIEDVFVFFSALDCVIINELHQTHTASSLLGLT